MWEIPVFRAEREAGLEEVIRSAARVSYAAVAELTRKFTISEAVIGQLGRGRAVATNEGQFDLHYLKTLLASTGWNLNEDVFDTQEVWAARHTPEDKPFNYEHDCKDIIGHITDDYVVDVEGKALADDTVVDSLPEKFHIVTNAVLYRCWPDKDRQERMDTIIAEIGEGKWYVSMEALFRGFDYAVVRADNTKMVVARNQDTAFLTKHLRAYGGTGTFNGMKVGRLMRNITFSGKGLVKKPANPESIIFSDTEPFTATAGKFSRSEMESGYGTVGDKGSPTKESKSMAADNEILVKQLDALKAENEKLQAEVRDSNVKQVTAAKTKLEADLKVVQDELLKVQADNKAYAETIEKVTAENVENAKSLKAAQDELAKIQATQQKAARVSTAKDKLGMADDKATKLVESLAGLSDEQFQATIQCQADNIAEYKAKADSVKSTSAPVAPASTPAPAVMGGPKKVKTIGPAGNEPPIAPVNASENETDPADANADTKVLDNAQANAEPALATAGTTDEGVETTRAAISDYMTGYLGAGNAKK